MPTRTALYRFFAADGSLLYVGIAFDPDVRQRQHERSAAMTWWPLQVRRTVEWFDSRPKAEAAEKEAISREQPRYNDRHNNQPDRAALAAWREQGRDKEKRRSIAGILSGQGRPPQSFSVAEYLRQRIDAGDLVAGDLLPKQLHVAKALGVSGPAVKAAYAELVADGYIEERRAKGYFVLAADARTIRIPIGLPETAAALLRASLSVEQLAALVAELGKPAERTARTP